MNRSQPGKPFMMKAKHTNDRLNSSIPQSEIAPAGRQLRTLLLALPAGVVFLAGCHRAHQNHTAADPALPSVQVCTQTVEAKPLVSFEEVVGTVRARLRATIEAKTIGRITDMPVILGQKVKAGEPLARLHAPEIRARLEQAEATLQQAERDSKRLSALLNRNAVAAAALEAADARYQVAKGAVAEARAMMAYVEILAPFDGVVTRKYVDVGARDRVPVEQGGKPFRIAFGLLQSGLGLFQASSDFRRMESGQRFSGFYFLAQDDWHVGDAANSLGLNSCAEPGSHRTHHLLEGNQGFGFDSLGADLNRRQRGVRGRGGLVRSVATGEKNHSRWQSEQERAQLTTCGRNLTLRN